MGNPLRLDELGCKCYWVSTYRFCIMINMIKIKIIGLVRIEIFEKMQHL